MRTLVFEQWQGGHYFNYLECLVPRLAEISDEVVVAVTESAASSRLFGQNLGHLRNIANVRFDTRSTIPQGRSNVEVRLAMAKNLTDASNRSQPDRIFLPSADEYILSVPLSVLSGMARGLRGVPVEAVLHYKSYTAIANVRERALSTMQRGLLKTGVFSQLHFVNCLQYEQAVSQSLPLVRMARAAGDPVPQFPRIDRSHARCELGIEPTGRLIGMVGGLDERKAVPATIAAFRASNLAKSDRLLLAGKLAPSFSQLIESDYGDLVRSGALIVLDRFLTEEELVNCFAALNLHCSLYSDFSGLSSLMLKSVAAGVPVLVNDRPGWTRAIVRRFGVGHAIDPADPASFAIGLRAALEASDQYSETEAVTRLLRFHSVTNFTEGLTQRLRALVGKEASTQLVEWSWVLEALEPELRTLS